MWRMVGGCPQHIGAIMANRAFYLGLSGKQMRHFWFKPKVQRRAQREHLSPRQ